MSDDGVDELVEHLVAGGVLERRDAVRVVEEVIAFFGETAEQFVRRRHSELQRTGLHNPEIFARVGEELGKRPVAARQYSARQLRRMVYG